MKCIKNEKGFTLVEMLIVMMIISVLLILIIPNVIKQQEIINATGCEAFQKNVQAQVQSYMLEHDGDVPTMDDLTTEGFLEITECPDGGAVVIETDGNVTINNE